MFGAVNPEVLVTAEELERINPPGKVVELIRGRLVVSEPPGTWHGSIAARLTVRLGGFVEREQLGLVFAQDTGFRIESNPDTVRAPDVSFLSRERTHLVSRRGYAAVAPDLAVEILSPDDSAGYLLDKAAAFIAAGTRLVWVIDPYRQEARVIRADGTFGVVDVRGALEGEEVLPGFRCPLSEVLAAP